MRSNLTRTEDISDCRWLVGLLVMGWLLPVAPAVARQSPAAIVIDANSGATLHASAADARRYPASLTKMMTIYLVFERLKQGRLTLSTPIRFSQRAANQQPSKLGLKAGDTITVGDAISALITKSANDVATARGTLGRFQPDIAATVVKPTARIAFSVKIAILVDSIQGQKWCVAAECDQRCRGQ